MHLHNCPSGISGWTIRKDSCLSYKLGAMGTSSEKRWGEVMAVVKSCFVELKEGCNRVCMNITVDLRDDGAHRFEDMVKSEGRL